MKPPLIVIAGPTASGKSSLALALSRRIDSTIINADASQVYRDLRIISARPSAEEESQAPHQLFGHIDGATACSAADWALDARAAIADAHAERRLPVLVGGTGLYIRTLLDGIAPVPEIDPAIRKTVRALPTAAAYAALSAEDPEAAARLAPADAARVSRALEVVRSTGKTLGEWQRHRKGGIGQAHNIVGLALLPPRDALYARCDARFVGMMAGGAIDEVEALLARNLDPALPVMRAIGVREIGAFLAGRINHETAIGEGQQATRQYAKRQYTWFRNQLPSHWLRHETQLNDAHDDKMVIKLQQMALTC